MIMEAKKLQKFINDLVEAGAELFIDDQSMGPIAAMEINETAAVLSYVHLNSKEEQPFENMHLVRIHDFLAEPKESKIIFRSKTGRILKLTLIETPKSELLFNANPLTNSQRASVFPDAY